MRYRFKGGSKYRAKKATVGGIEFDSKKEGQEYLRLSKMMEEGTIWNLRLQVTHEVIPKCRWSDGHMERAVKYVSDFEYDDENGHHVIDVKGYNTKDFIIKRKAMKVLHDIEIELR